VHLAQAFLAARQPPAGAWNRIEFSAHFLTCQKYRHASSKVNLFPDPKFDYSRPRITNMLPSSTVENYLKTIYLGSSAPGTTQRLLPMGQLASAVGVTPGTATTMVKALAESGLVKYAPYSASP
jgi:hypothetical protein